jgi:hypothetical protein
VVAGTANDPNARDRGRRAGPLADAAWALIEKGFGDERGSPRGAA